MFIQFKELNGEDIIIHHNNISSINESGEFKNHLKIVLMNGAVLSCYGNFYTFLEKCNALQTCDDNESIRIDSHDRISRIYHDKTISDVERGNKLDVLQHELTANLRGLDIFPELDFRIDQLQNALFIKKQNSKETNNV